jgi:hypothetical protein
MWHSSVDYWVCYRMFRSKRMKAFPRVAWPSLYKAGDVTNWCQSMRDFLEWHPPACGWPGELV